MRERLWKIGERVFNVSRRGLIMGVLNVTPDSFSDGGNFFEAEKAIEHGLRMAAEGADIIDIGGESTRPGAEPIAADEELRRVIPVIETLRVKIDVPISIDTSKSSVARAAIRVAGAPPRRGRAHPRDCRPAATPARARAWVPGGSDGVLSARFGVARARAVLARAGSGTPLAFQPPCPATGREVAPEQSDVTVAVRRPTTARPRVDGRVV